MKSKCIQILLACAILMLLSGCANAPSVAHFKQQKNTEHLSAAAYERIVPSLTALKPGDVIANKIKWRYWELKKGGRTTMFSIADGWAAPLSDDWRGSTFGLGRIIGRSGNTLYGEQVFGYLMGGTTLKPQYVVISQATLIEPDEYARLMKTKAERAGWAKTRRGKYPITQYKNAVVKDVRRIGSGEKIVLGGEGVTVEKAGTLADVLRSRTSRERYESALKRVKALKPGTDYWTAVSKLNVIYMTPDAGVEYILLGDGLLRGVWQKLTPKGYFTVMRFGYSEEGKEVPKYSLIFKNNQLYKLVTQTTQEELLRLMY